MDKIAEVKKQVNIASGLKWYACAETGVTIFFNAAQGVLQYMKRQGVQIQQQNSQTQTERLFYGLICTNLDGVYFFFENFFRFLWGDSININDFFQ